MQSKLSWNRLLSSGLLPTMVLLQTLKSCWLPSTLFPRYQAQRTTCPTPISLWPSRRTSTALLAARSHMSEAPHGFRRTTSALSARSTSSSTSGSHRTLALHLELVSSSRAIRQRRPRQSIPVPRHIPIETSTCSCKCCPGQTTHPRDRAPA